MSQSLLNEAYSLRYTFVSNLIKFSEESITEEDIEMKKQTSSISALPEKSGWLFKNTSNLIHPWPRRFFVLKDKVLRYSHKEDDIIPSGTLNLDQVSVDVQVKRVKNGAEMHILPHGSKVRFRLKAISTEILIEWATALYQHIEASKGFKHELTSISTKPNFFRFQRISNSQFKHQSSTGDLLLFRGKSFGSRFQRGITRSKYDHVAMILIFQTSNVAILEATANDGVEIVFWDDFIRFNWHKLYSRLVYRHLELERDEEMLHSLDDYIQEVRGKPYSCSPYKLMGLGHRQDPGSERNFFCSELIASAYKRLGILPQDLNAKSVWPGSFSDDSILPLIKGKIGGELLIDFEL